jgi:hypothetical protein
MRKGTPLLLAARPTRHLSTPNGDATPGPITPDMASSFKFCALGSGVERTALFDDFEVADDPVIEESK